MEISTIYKGFNHILCGQNQCCFQGSKKAKICLKTVIFPVFQILVPFSAKKRLFDQFLPPVTYTCQKLLTPTLQAVRTRFRANHIGSFSDFLVLIILVPTPSRRLRIEIIWVKIRAIFEKTGFIPYFAPQKSMLQNQKMAAKWSCFSAYRENLKKNWRKKSLDKDRPGSVWWDSRYGVLRKMRLVTGQSGSSWRRL